MEKRDFAIGPDNHSEFVEPLQAIIWSEIAEKIRYLDNTFIR